MTTKHTRRGRAETIARGPVDVPDGGPRPLPHAAYPRARDVARHGLQPLPESLSPADLARARPHRSVRYSAVVATELTTDHLLQAAWVIAEGFARREPQSRHLRPPKRPPAGLTEARRADPFGNDPFGSWGTRRRTCTGSCASSPSPTPPAPKTPSS